MASRRFAVRTWDALTEPEHNTLPGVVAADAPFRSRLWVALTRRQDHPDTRQFVAAAQNLSSREKALVRAGAQGLIALADQAPLLRQACIDALSSFLRSTGGADRPDVRKAILAAIATRLREDEGALWQGCDLNLQGSDLQGVDFSRVIFAGSQDFSGCSFNDDVTSFSGAIFRGPASFQGCGFNGGRVDFSRSYFASDVDFSDCGFNGGLITFEEAKFLGDTRFTDCGFNGSVLNFQRAAFQSGSVDFTGSGFVGSEINFQRAQFGGGVVDIHAPGRFDQPPVFDPQLELAPPPGLLLPVAA